MFKVVYLTGAPASGKSSVCSAVKAKVPKTVIFRYGKVLTDYVKQRMTDVTQEGLRSSSSMIVHPSDVKEVDRQMVEFVSRERSKNHVIIDTHALTRELYGFRMTPVSEKDIKAISPNFMVTLMASPQTTRERTRKKAEGRPQLSDWQFQLQTSLQNTIPVTYSIICGAPAYFIENESEENFDQAVNEISRLLNE